jgi:hypothetical protein
MTKWWSDICQKIEARDFHQWSDVATILLGFSMDEQGKLAARFKRITKNVKKNWRQPNHLCSITLMPPKGKSDAIAVYGFREQHKDQRHARMENVAAQVFSSSHAARCLVLGINVDQQHYPYSILAIYFRPAEDAPI